MSDVSESSNADPFWVEAEVKRRGKRLAELAAEAGVHHSTVTQARFRIIPRGNRIIANFLGASVHELWPEWFDVAGNRIRSFCESDDGRSADQRHRQKGAAA
ncbi:helix-turn-helix domain-containing protein [Thalassobaculum litoreum]|uniref:helix-turn-helix domain-containing protein n=1 Tax=Thalassobaculum litoreum TaxID=420996 RepID=UPI000B84143C|nr:helix-turn-helix domain-containing protein [Thalassobaculum litoreum]